MVRPECVWCLKHSTQPLHPPCMHPTVLAQAPGLQSWQEAAGFEPGISHRARGGCTGPPCGDGSSGRWQQPSQAQCVLFHSVTGSSHIRKYQKPKQPPPLQAAWHHTWMPGLVQGWEGHTLPPAIAAAPAYFRVEHVTGMVQMCCSCDPSAGCGDVCVCF